MKKGYANQKGILGILIFTMLIPFFLICVFLTYVNFHTSKNLLSQNLNSSCSIEVNAINAYFSSYADSLKFLASMEPVQNYASSGGQVSAPEQKLISNLLQNEQSVKSTAQAIFIVDHTGQIVISTNSNKENELLAHCSVPKQIRDGSFSLQYLVSDSRENDNLLILYPIVDEKTQVQYGYLGCILKTEQLQTQLDAAVLPDYGVMTLQDESGQTVSFLSSQQDNMLSLQSSLKNAQENEQAKTAPSDTSVSEPAKGSIISSNQSFTFSSGSGLGTEDYVAYHCQIGTTGWTFTIACRSSSLLHTIIQITLLIVLVVLLGMATWVVLSIYASRRILAPMKKLVDQLSIEAQRNYILNDLSGVMIIEYDCETDTLWISPEYAQTNHLPSMIDHFSLRLEQKMPLDGTPLPDIKITDIKAMGDTGSVDCPVFMPDGHTERYRLTFAKIRNEKNAVVRVLFRASNIEQEYHEWAKLQAEATIDGLTGIYNRQAGERLVKEYLSSMPNRISSALILIDLDQFKPINDNFGHQTGDQVLRDTAHALRDYFREDDVVFRLGGDEFMALVKSIHFDSLALRLITLIQQFESSSHEGPTVTFSMGVICFDKPHADYETLYHAADRALYRAKNEHSIQIVHLTDAHLNPEQ